MREGGYWDWCDESDAAYKKLRALYVERFYRDPPAGDRVRVMIGMDSDLQDNDANHGRLGPSWKSKRRKPVAA